MWLRTGNLLATLAVGAYTVSGAIIYQNDFSSDPSADFTTYYDGASYVYDGEADRVDAQRNVLERASWYQLTGAATSQADVFVKTAINITVGTPNNLYAVIGGLYGRATPGAGTYSQGYYALLGRPSWDRDDPTVRLYLGKDFDPNMTGTAADMGTVLSTGTYEASGSTDYILKLSMNDTYLVAQLWNGAGDTLLEQLSADDSQYSSGNVGFVTAVRSSSTHYLYDDFLVDNEPLENAVPEPGTSLLWLLGLASCVRRRRFRVASVP